MAETNRFPRPDVAAQATQNAGAPPASRYLRVAQVLLVTATFAGAITFNVLLTVANPPTKVQSLLGFASALFLASITGLFPIMLVLQRVPDDQHPNRLIFYIVVGGYCVVATLMCVAFILLMIVIKEYTVQGAFVLGIVLLGINTVLTLWAAGWNACSY